MAASHSHATTSTSASAVGGDEKRIISEAAPIVIEDKSESRFKRVTVAEAKASRPYWDLVRYRHERMAKFQLLGLAKILKYLHTIPQLKKLPEEAKAASPYSDPILLLLFNFFVKNWLFSSHERFDSEFTLAKSITLLRKIEIADLKELHHPAKLDKLRAAIVRIRNMGKKDIAANRLTQRFMQEPHDEDKDTVFATHITRGDWTQLDFSNPEFLRRLTKALRLNQITKYDYATAQSLHAGYQFFGSLPEQFTYSDKTGPFRPEAYFLELEPTWIAEFKRQEEKLPENQRCYFTFKMSRELMVLYLHFSITNLADFKARPYLLEANVNFIHGSSSYYPKLFIYQCLLADTLEAYIRNQREQHPTDNFEPAELLIRKLRLPRSSIFVKDYEAVSKLISWYEHKNEAMEKLLLEKDLSPAQSQQRDSSEQLHFDIKTYDRMVFLLFDKDSLQMAVPSTASLNLLLKVIFPNAISAEYVLGHLTTRKMKAIQQSSMRRGASLAHPDVIPPQKPHDLDMNAFAIMRHDNHHLYSDSNFLPRKFMIYAVRLVVGVKQHEMDPAIWELIDCDFNKPIISSEYSRFTPKQRLEDLEAMLHGVLFQTIDTNVRSFLTDYSLIFLFDMIKNRASWESFLGALVVNRIFSNPKNHAQINLAQIIHDKYPNKTILFKILAYRLCSKIYENDAVTIDAEQRDQHCRLLDFFDRYSQIRNYFKWVVPDAQHLHFDARFFDAKYSEAKISATVPKGLPKKLQAEYRIKYQDSEFLFKYIQAAVAISLQESLKRDMTQETMLIVRRNFQAYFSLAVVELLAQDLFKLIKQKGLCRELEKKHVNNFIKTMYEKFDKMLELSPSNFNKMMYDIYIDLKAFEIRYRLDFGKHYLSVNQKLAEGIVRAAERFKQSSRYASNQVKTTIASFSSGVSTSIAAVPTATTTATPTSATAVPTTTGTTLPVAVSAMTVPAVATITATAAAVPTVTTTAATVVPARAATATLTRTAVFPAVMVPTLEEAMRAASLLEVPAFGAECKEVLPATAAVVAVSSASTSSSSSSTGRGNSISSVSNTGTFRLITVAAAPTEDSTSVSRNVTTNKRIL